MAKRKNGTVTRTWVTRGLIAIALGLGAGFAAGAMAVRVLQSPGVSASDSIASDAARRTKRSATAAVIADDSSAAIDPAPPANRRIAGTLVPQLVGLQEGDARAAITHAGFTIGSVSFKSSGEQAGTVLSTSPSPGEFVQLPATVNLVLSDGHVRRDSTNTPAVLPTPSLLFDFDFNFQEHPEAP